VLDLEALAKESRAGRVAVLDSWLAGLLADAVAGTPPPRQRRGAAPPRTGTDGLALVAVGSLGRREPPPHGDVDLVLVHDGRPEIAALADALWDPLWVGGLRM
jgi:[protein-PII] uridylyltransferase